MYNINNFCKDGEIPGKKLGALLWCAFGYAADGRGFLYGKIGEKASGTEKGNQRGGFSPGNPGTLHLNQIPRNPDPWVHFWFLGPQA